MYTGLSMLQSLTLGPLGCPVWAGRFDGTRMASSLPDGSCVSTGRYNNRNNYEVGKSVILMGASTGMGICSCG